jgi:hypothetical protein
MGIILYGICYKISRIGNTGLVSMFRYFFYLKTIGIVIKKNKIDLKRPADALKKSIINFFI